MRSLFKRLSILTASLAMVFGVGLVSEEENARAAEIEYKSLSFPDDNKENNKVSAYDTSWTAKMVLTHIPLTTLIIIVGITNGLTSKWEVKKQLPLER